MPWTENPTPPRDPQPEPGDAAAEPVPGDTVAEPVVREAAEAELVSSDVTAEPFSGSGDGDAADPVAEPFDAEPGEAAAAEPVAGDAYRDAAKPPGRALTEAERRMLAQVTGRQQLSGSIAGRFVSAQASARAAIRMSPSLAQAPLAAPRPTSAVPALVPPRARGRSVTGDSDWHRQVQRFWWRRLLPHQTLLARREREARARRSVPAQRVAPALLAFAPPPAQAMEPSVATNVGWPAGSAAPDIMPEVAADASQLSAGEASQAGPTEVSQVATRPGGLRGLWQRVGMILAPTETAAGPAAPEVAARAPVSGASQASPAASTTPSQGSTVVESTTAASASGPTPFAPTSSDPAAAAPAASDRTATAPTAPVLPSSIAVPAPIPATDAPDTTGGLDWSADLTSSLPIEAEELEHAPGLALDQAPSTQIAPLAADVAGRAAAYASVGLSSLAFDAQAPSRVFWWPTRRDASAPGAVGPAASDNRSTAFERTPSAQPSLDSQRDAGPFARVDESPVGRAAPGLLGSVLLMQHAVTASVRQRRAVLEAIGRAERWAEASTAERESWRPRPASAQVDVGQAALTAGPATASSDLPSTAVAAPIGPTQALSATAQSPRGDAGTDAPGGGPADPGAGSLAGSSVGAAGGATAGPEPPWSGSAGFGSTIGGAATIAWPGVGPIGAGGQGSGGLGDSAVAAAADAGASETPRSADFGAGSRVAGASVEGAAAASSDDVVTSSVSPGVGRGNAFEPVRRVLAWLALGGAARGHDARAGVRLTPTRVTPESPSVTPEASSMTLDRSRVTMPAAQATSRQPIAAQAESPGAPRTPSDAPEAGAVGAPREHAEASHGGFEASHAGGIVPSRRRVEFAAWLAPLPFVGGLVRGLGGGRAHGPEQRQPWPAPAMADSHAGAQAGQAGLAAVTIGASEPATTSADTAPAGQVESTDAQLESTDAQLESTDAQLVSTARQPESSAGHVVSAAAQLTATTAQPAAPAEGVLNAVPSATSTAADDQRDARDVLGALATTPAAGAPVPAPPSAPPRGMHQSRADDWGVPPDVDPGPTVGRPAALWPSAAAPPSGTTTDTAGRRSLWTVPLELIAAPLGFFRTRLPATGADQQGSSAQPAMPSPNLSGVPGTASAAPATRTESATPQPAQPIKPQPPDVRPAPGFTAFPGSALPGAAASASSPVGSGDFAGPPEDPTSRTRAYAAFTVEDVATLGKPQARGFLQTLWSRLSRASGTSASQAPLDFVGAPTMTGPRAASAGPPHTTLQDQQAHARQEPQQPASHEHQSQLHTAHSAAATPYPDLPHGLPERPWEASDRELADVISQLPGPMAAAAIAAGVLGDSAGASLQPLPSSDPRAGPRMVMPVGPTRAVAHAAQAARPAEPTGQAGQPGPTGWASPIHQTHGPVFGPSMGAGQSASSTAMAGAAASAGLSRAPIDRAVTDAPPSSVTAGSATAADPTQATQDDEQKLERLADEVFERLRWRLAIERERHMG